MTMAAEVAKRTLNVNEYHKMAEVGILKREEHLELIHGELYDKYLGEKRPITVEEYYKMAEVGILKPNDRVELINGEIYQMSPIGSKHAGVVNRLARIFNELFKNQVTVSVQAPIRLDDKTEPEPDMSILKFRSDDYFSGHPTPEDILAIIEVANSSLKHDKEVKVPLYARYGIPVYWIIDIDNRKIEVYQNPDGQTYRQQLAYSETEEISLLKKSIPIQELLPH